MANGVWKDADNDGIREYCRSGSWSQTACIYTSASCLPTAYTTPLSGECKNYLAECVGDCKSNCQGYLAECCNLVACSNNPLGHYCKADCSCGCRNDADCPSGKHCNADGVCVECTKDDDCKDASGNWRYDPVNHTKIVCDCPSGSCTYPPPPTGSDDYTCKPLPSCRTTTDDCADGWCCDRETVIPKGSGSCVKGIYSANSTYLCDPPEWNSGEASKKQSLLDLLLSFFFNPFS
ncbi:MAG: hypothetical protein QXE05_00950 [Nitrososphaeria archaeon]